MIKHLFFDFDGTISDSYPLFMEIFRDLSAANGWELPYNDEELLHHLLVSVKAAHRDLGWDKFIEYADFWNAFQTLQTEKALKFKAFPQAVELLRYATEKGIKCYVYTHSGRVVVDKMFRSMGIDGYITDSVDKSMGFPEKPAPDALLYMLKKHGLKPEECMMVGDRPIDAEAGVNAGMRGCLWDLYGIFADRSPDLYVRHLEDVKNLI